MHPYQRYCDICLNPYTGRGVNSTCTLDCPSRRGLRRSQVVDELMLGHIDPGVHPRSRLLRKAQARLMMQGQLRAAEIQALQDQMTDLQFRLRVVDNRRREEIAALMALLEHGSRTAATTRGEASGPD